MSLHEIIATHWISDGWWQKTVQDVEAPKKILAFIEYDGTALSDYD